MHRHLRALVQRLRLREKLTVLLLVSCLGLVFFAGLLMHARYLTVVEMGQVKELAGLNEVQTVSGVSS